jgi:predicted lipid-binding transport protein (Tim44 family)
METIKKLRVEVIYKVGLGDVEMPKEVYEQILQAAKNGDTRELDGRTGYPDAFEWLSNNIRERDCNDWSVKIEEAE